MPFYPGPGVGGHCIPIDPYYLTYKSREYDWHTRLIETAGEINDYMPEYVVQRLQDILNEFGKPMKGSRILVLGVTYKGDVADLRESPALKVIENLEKKKAKVLFYDPLIESFEHRGMRYERSELTEDLLRSVDGVIITTAHKHGVDYQFVVDNAPFVYDTKNITKSIKKNREKIILL